MRFAALLPVVAASALLALVVGCQKEELVEIPEEEPADEEPAAPADEEPEAPDTSGDSCTDDSDCGANSECASGVCVGVGVLQVTLSFDVDADYDLHVVTPSGQEIYWDNTSADGGVLDVDQCIVSCGFGSHLENIFFNGAREPGLYLAWVENYDGRDGGAFRIDVSGDADTFLEGSLLAFPGEISEELAFSIED